MLDVSGWVSSGICWFSSGFLDVFGMSPTFPKKKKRFVDVFVPLVSCFL